MHMIPHNNQLFHEPSEELPAPLVHVFDHGLNMELQQLEVSVRALLPLVSAAVELRNLSFSVDKADIVLMIVPTIVPMIVPMPHLSGKTWKSQSFRRHTFSLPFLYPRPLYFTPVN